MKRIKRNTFDKIILVNLRNSTYPSPESIDLNADNFETEKDYVIQYADKFVEYDKYINSEVVLPREGERFQSAKIICWATKSDRTSMGSYNSNPILDTKIYEVMFNNVSTQEYAANRKALSMYDQDDDNRYMTRLLDSIQRHWKNNVAVGSSDASERRADILSLSTRNIYELSGQVTLTKLTR